MKLFAVIIQIIIMRCKVNENKCLKKRIKSKIEARQKLQFQYIVSLSVLFSSFIAILFKRKEIFVFVGIVCYYNIRYILIQRRLTDKNIMLYQEINIFYYLPFQGTRSCLQHIFKWRLYFNFVLVYST